MGCSSLGGEVRLVLGRVPLAIGGLLASACICRTGSTRAGLAGGLDVLGAGTGAVAVAGGAGAARAAGAGDAVLRGGLVAGAVKSGLLAAGALGLLGTDALGALAAAGGGLVNNHCDVCGGV